MNLSFLPGQLFLNKEPDGSYVITLKGDEVFRGKMEKKAITKYNKLRAELEQQFPAREMSSEEKAQLLNKHIATDSISHNGDRHQKQRIKSGSTRTFG